MQQFFSPLFDPRAVLLLVLILALAHAASADFDAVDANHDGSIDRTEYQRVQPAVDAFHSAFHIMDGAAKTMQADPVPGGGGSLPNLQDEGFVSAFFNALLVILATEVGDKTFFIAAILAMRNGRLVVYLGAMGALAVMHVLSCLMGYALPALLPRTYTHFLGAILFAYFGFKLLYDAREMGDGPSEELLEVEEELISKKEGAGSTPEPDIEEDGGSGKNKVNVHQGVVGLIITEWHIFSQVLTLTFLAEWGDRSQIATIALASSRDLYGVIAGGLLGHAFCTGVAVIGGRMLASRISEKSVAIVGGFLFLAFAVHSFVVGPL